MQDQAREYMRACFATLDRETQAGLDVGLFDDAAEQIAWAIDDSRVVEIEFAPGNMTRYPLVIVPLLTTTRWRQKRAVSGMSDGDHDALIVLVERSAYPLQLAPARSYISPDYVAEKWTDGNLHDGAVLAALFNAVGGSY